MAQRSKRVTSAKSTPKPPTPPQRLTRRQIAREFGRIGDKYSIAETSRRTGIPQSTLRSWIKKGTVSKKGLERSRKALPKARRIRRIVSAKERRQRQERKRERAAQKAKEIQSAARRENAASAVHLAFATGIAPILSGAKLTQPSFDKIASAISKGGPLPRAPAITDKRLTAIRSSAYLEYSQRNGAATNDGFDYRNQHEPTDAGQLELSESWIIETREYFKHEGLNIPIHPLGDVQELLADFEERQSAVFYTENATAMYQITEYVKPIPAFLVLVTYESLMENADVYEVKVWVARDSSAARQV